MRDKSEEVIGLKHFVINIINNMEINKIKKTIEDGVRLREKTEQLIQGILNDDSIPRELKFKLIQINKEFEEQRLKDEKYIEDNKHRKVIGYNPENFMPIYED